MFAHVTVRATDPVASERFYATVLAALERPAAPARRWAEFRIAAAGTERPATRRLHIGFAARSRRHVDAFWRAGIAAGYRDDGPPGPRPQYRDDYYGAFLLDPDANSAEAVHHGALPATAAVDHLWIRVADVAAARDFYATLAETAGLRLRADTPDRAQFVGAGGSFSLVSGQPTENLHMGLSAVEDAGPMTDPDGNLVELVGR